MGEQSAASNDQFPSSEVAPWSLVLSSAKLVSLKAPQFTLLMKHVLRTTLSTPAAHTRVFLHDKSFYPGCTTHIPSKSGPRPGYGCSPWAEAEEAQCWQQAFHLSSFFFFPVTASGKINKPQILPSLCLPIPILVSTAAVALPLCLWKLWTADWIGRIIIFQFLQNIPIHC